ncbi:MAG: hypothetical protein COV67_13880 [Nitrospinae bacterium CG11_big_fil_rev_8_21_14_0_20_56_8]|nr:MAG: hypothetical protein COV67_13880 [Nitrospinae bacterium CG11_big_fil_rev_8_21_14_0_20_56_8]
MTPEELDRTARGMIRPGSPLVNHHMEIMQTLVGIDSRSFNVNEFEGDRTTPSDMREILECAQDYLAAIGFSDIRINCSPSGKPLSNPLLLAKIDVSPEKPTVLFYAHLDKQPYMDDATFQKWEGTAPTRLRWNKDGTRAYGRGAADDLSGVVATGLCVDALLRGLGGGLGNKIQEAIRQLPCNIKIMFETEEECGSHSLVEQMLQNKPFFEGTDCVVITDVVNPATGVPGLTTTLRGILVFKTTLVKRDPAARIDEQTALYKLTSTLIREDHSLAIEGIARSDRPVTPEEDEGYRKVPTSVEQLRETGGLLAETRLTVPEDTAEVLKAQLRKSYANVRPGLRVAGSVIFGQAGARLFFSGVSEPDTLKRALEARLQAWNRFELKLTLREVSREAEQAVFDLTLQSASQDPHSGINGGPFPVAELQLAQMVDRLVGLEGTLHPEIAPWVQGEIPSFRTAALFVDSDGSCHPFEENQAKAVVEIRLAPGNTYEHAAQELRNHLLGHVPNGFALEIEEFVGASPWMTEIAHPVFRLALEALSTGFKARSCLYGCGGSIPFVPKLMTVLGDAPPLCLGAYDPEARMHEPNESLSMADLLGCARAMVYLISWINKAFPKD